MRRAHLASTLAARLAARLVARVTTLAAAALLAGCEGTTSLLGPGGAELAATTGGAGITVGALAGESLVGRWTRVDGAAPGVIVETTFSFLGGGSGARVIVTRTALGAVLAEDRQPFTWTAGGGVVMIRIQGALGETILRAAFAVQSDLTGTTLRLDGLPYRRAS